MGAGTTEQADDRVPGDDPAPVPTNDVALEGHPHPAAEDDLVADLGVVLGAEPHRPDHQLDLSGVALRRPPR